MTYSNVHRGWNYLGTYLEVHFRLVLAEGGHAGKQGLALDPGLGQHQQQRADQSEVTEQEL